MYSYRALAIDCCGVQCNGKGRRRKREGEKKMIAYYIS